MRLQVNSATATHANRVDHARGTGAWAILPALLMLGGCSSFSLDPVDWWHDLEGGRIAETRPPPPNSDAPYPSLGTVPTKPQAIDAATRGQIANALVADRANAQYGASQAPLGVAASSLPGAARQVTPPPAGGALSASLPAASGPAEAPVSARPAPVARVERAALPAPEAPAPVAAPASAPAAGPVAEAPMPSIPAGPPPPPTVGGVPVLVAPTPPPTPPPAVAAAPAVPGAPMALPFAPGSAALSPAAQAGLKGLAAARAGHRIVVAGFGEATGSDAAAQIAAMPLAWLRAQAISGALQAAGVPVAQLQITAEAAGQGGVARIAN